MNVESDKCDKSIPAGLKVYDLTGAEWKVHLPEISVKCVRLVRFNGEANEYRDIPLEDFNVLPDKSVAMPHTTHRQ